MSLIVLSRSFQVVGPTSAARALFRLWTWRDKPEEISTFTRSWLKWSHFSFSSLRKGRVTDFVLLLLPIRTTHCCVCVAAIHTAIPRRVCDCHLLLCSITHPMTHPTAQPQCAFVYLHTTSTDQHARDADSTQLRDCTALRAPLCCACLAAGQGSDLVTDGPSWFWWGPSSVVRC